MKHKDAKRVNLALIGAGNRGAGIFGRYALDMPHRAVFSAVVEKDPEKLESFASAHGIPPERRFSNYEDFFSRGFTDIDGVVIATLEDERLNPALLAMDKGYNIIMEKPIALTAHELVELYDSASEYPGIFIVCHQLRIAPRYLMLKRLVDSGKYGEIVCVQHSENLSYSHMAHSFVRGLFNSSRMSPMLLAKSCHDLDFLSYLVGRRPVRVASFGGLKYFRPENAPEGAPDFCLDGCRHYRECPYHVIKLYFSDETDRAFLRQMGVVKDRRQLLELLKTSRFGRCVFRAGNDVVDNQTVQVEFEGGAHASFTMCGHNGAERRMTKLSMTNGEIDSNGLGSEIRTYSFEPLFEETIRVNTSGTHGGGDRAIMDNFIDAVETGDRSILLTPIQKSFEGHMLVFAAEESRRTGTVIGLKEYEDRIRSSKTAPEPA